MKCCGRFDDCVGCAAASEACCGDPGDCVGCVDVTSLSPLRALNVARVCPHPEAEAVADDPRSRIVHTVEPRRFGKTRILEAAALLEAADAEPDPRFRSDLGNAVMKLRWSVDSGEWSARILPAEADAILKRLGLDRPSGHV